MNRALWKKAVSEAWFQLTISSILLVAFSWLFVWLMSLFKIGAWGTLLNLLPSFVEPMLGIPLAKLATPTGQISILYVHVITLLVCIGWAVGRGSEVVSGEIARGTMDLLLSLPIRRVEVLVVAAVVATLGAAILAGSVWLGSCIGLMTIDLPGTVAPQKLIAGAVNLFAMTACLTGITTFLSSWDHDRWRTIWLAGGFFAVSSVIEMTSRMWPPGAWLKYFTFLTAFEPQRLILVPPESWWGSVKPDLLLLSLGLIAYAAAAIVLSTRDIPAAL